jgi:hypothetical protein
MVPVVSSAMADSMHKKLKYFQKEIKGKSCNLPPLTRYVVGGSRAKDLTIASQREKYSETLVTGMG